MPAFYSLCGLLGGDNSTSSHYLDFFHSLSGDEEDSTHYTRVSVEVERSHTVLL